MVSARQPALQPVAPFALAALLVVISLAAVPPVDAQSTDQRAAVAVSNVTASTQTPTAEEPFSLRVTIANYEGSGQAVTLNQLVVVDGDRQYIADDIGSLTPGSRTTVSVPLTIDDPGQQTVNLQVYGSSGGRLVNTRSPYVVEVREPHARA